MRYSVLGKCFIYRPAGEPMQAGRRRKWVLEYKNHHKVYTNPIVGWTASDDVVGHIQLSFETLEEAVTYAESSGIQYTVRHDKPVGRVKKAYQDNFLPRKKFGE